MFGEAFDNVVEKKKKELAMQDIQGQEWDPQTLDYTEDGIRIEPFNLEQEMQEG
jgi:hypothetical protein